MNTELNPNAALFYPRVPNSKMHATTVTYATIKDLVAKKQFDIALKIFKTSLEPHMPYDLSILETSYSKMYEDVMNMLSEITKNGTFNEKHIAKEIIQERALYAIDQTFDPNEEITRACHFFYTEFHTLSDELHKKIKGLLKELRSPTTKTILTYLIKKENTLNFINTLKNRLYKYTSLKTAIPNLIYPVLIKHITQLEQTTDSDRYALASMYTALEQHAKADEYYTYLITHKSSYTNKQDTLQNAALSRVKNKELLRPDDIKYILDCSPYIYKELMTTEKHFERKSYNTGMLLFESLKTIQKKELDYQYVAEKTLMHLTYAGSNETIWNKDYKNHINNTIHSVQRNLAQIYYNKKQWQKAYNCFASCNATLLEDEKRNFLITRIKCNDMLQKNDIEYICSFLQNLNSVSIEIQEFIKEIIEPCALYIRKHNDYELPLQLINILLSLDNTKPLGITLLCTIHTKLDVQQQLTWYTLLSQSTIHDKLLYKKNNSLDTTTLVMLGDIFADKIISKTDIENNIKYKNQAIAYFTKAYNKKEISKEKKKLLKKCLRYTYCYLAELQKDTTEIYEKNIEMAAQYSNSHDKLLWYKKLFTSNSINAKQIREGILLFEHHAKENKNPDPEVINLLSDLYLKYYCKIEYESTAHITLCDTLFNAKKTFTILEKAAHSDNYNALKALGHLYGAATLYELNTQTSKYYNIKRAIKWYTRYIELQKEPSPYLFYNRGSMYYANNQEKDAEKDFINTFERIINKNNFSAAALFMLGMLYSSKNNQKDKDKAIEYMNHAYDVLANLPNESKLLFLKSIPTDSIYCLRQICVSYMVQAPRKDHTLMWSCITLKFLCLLQLYDKVIVSYIKTMAKNNNIEALYTLIINRETILTTDELANYINKLLSLIEPSHPYSPIITQLIASNMTDKSQAMSAIYILHNYYKNNPQKLQEFLTNIPKDLNIKYQYFTTGNDKQQMLDSPHLLKQYADEYIKDPTNQPGWKKNAALILGSAKSCCLTQTSLTCAACYLQVLYNTSTLEERKDKGITEVLINIYTHLAKLANTENLQNFYIKKINATT